jgi:hypothetical protein
MWCSACCAPFCTKLAPDGPKSNECTLHGDVAVIDAREVVRQALHPQLMQID